jgi:hypothetical protein
MSADPELFNDISVSTVPPGAILYKKCKLPSARRYGGQTLLDASLSTLADGFEKVVATEGPIFKETAKRRVAEAWGTRIGNRINNHLEAAIEQAKRQKKLVARGDFLWPVGMTRVPLRIHGNGNGTRPIREIPPEEVARAIKECVGSAVGISQDDLVREVCRLFGLKVTTDNTYAINYYIQYLISNNYLAEKNGKIIRTSNSS